MANDFRFQRRYSFQESGKEMFTRRMVLYSND